MEVLITCANIMSYRTNVQYLVFYIMSSQKWESTNNFLNHYRQQPPANANLHYHSGICVIDLEPLSRGQHPLAIYYKLHTFLQTPRVRTMVAGVVFWDHMTYNPKFPNLHTTDYKVSHDKAIRKITSNGYKLQVITSRGTHGDTYSLTSFEQTCYMPLILNFPVNMDLMVTCNVQGPTINFAKVTCQSFEPLHNLLYYLTQGQFYYNLGGIWYPAHQSFP